MASKFIKNSELKFQSRWIRNVKTESFSVVFLAGLLLALCGFFLFGLIKVDTYLAEAYEILTVGQYELETEPGQLKLTNLVKDVQSKTEVCWAMSWVENWADKIIISWHLLMIQSDSNNGFFFCISVSLCRFRLFDDCLILHQLFSCHDHSIIHENRRL